MESIVSDTYMQTAPRSKSYNCTLNWNPVGLYISRGFELTSDLHDKALRADTTYCFVIFVPSRNLLSGWLGPSKMALSRKNLLEFQSIRKCHKHLEDITSYIEQSKSFICMLNPKTLNQD